MSSLPELEKLGEAEFMWGQKGGVGGKNKKVQFYKSFTYDGVDYALYDCLYMYKEGEPAPYIGKLVKVWENVDKSKRVKIQWFFRPSEISYYLSDAEVLANELFLASGEGIGLTNLNPLEAIAGKCNVVCISTDSRNPQPSSEERQMADYVFYRTFDVKSFIISDQLDDKVGGLEVEHVFNRTKAVRKLYGPKLDSNYTNDERNVDAFKATLEPAGKSSIQQLDNLKLDKNSDHLLEEDTSKMLVPVKQGSLLVKHSSGVNVIYSKDRVTTGTTMEERSMPGAENVGFNVTGDKDEFTNMKSLLIEVQVEGGVKSAGKSCNLVGASSNKAKSDGTISSSKVQDICGVQSLTIPGNDAANSKPSPEIVNNSVANGKDVELPVNTNKFDDNLSNSESSLSQEARRSGCAEDDVGFHRESKSNKELIGSQGKLSKSYSFTSTEKLESEHAKDSARTEEVKELGGNLSAFKDRLLTSNVASCDETLRTLTTIVSPNGTPMSGSNKDFEGSRSAAKLTQGSTSLTKRPLKRSADLPMEKSSLGREKYHENKDKILASNLCPTEERSLKKAKPDDTIKQSDDNNIRNSKEKTCLGETKKSPKLPMLYDNKAKARLDETTLKVCHNEKDGNLSSDNLSNALTSRPRGGGKFGDQVIEVTRRPIEKSKWIKLPWEEKMKTAHDDGRLVMLHNLDPKYTSGEVEDIIWCVFKEKCTAKMVQHTVVSNPQSGQALVIFGSREAADRVLQKLDDGCLMLPNQRPLVGCHGVLHNSCEKQTTFVGHLTIDKARRQIQREMKNAVATSHYSQNNTIEHEMAMDWCLLQSKSDAWWEKLYEQQREYITKLKGNLKPKKMKKW